MNILNNKILILSISLIFNHFNKPLIKSFHPSNDIFIPLSTLAPLTKIVGLKPEYLFPVVCLN